jgi:hypothetical protein
MWGLKLVIDIVSAFYYVGRLSVFVLLIFERISVLVKSILSSNPYISQMRLANSSGDKPGMGSP